MRETLYEQLIKYRDSDYYGFHMPGHKRNENLTGAVLPYGIDITEIEGFDDLHHAEGILKETQKRAAAVYGAEETHYLINGSTAGILSAVLGCTKKGDTILMARNCHKSVYHAVFLNELRAKYVYPQYLEEQELNGEIRAEDVRRILQENCNSHTRHSQEGESPTGRSQKVDSRTECSQEGTFRTGQIRAVIIVSPTYDGVVSDVRAIAEEVHKYGIPLIVDEAHGAHFGFHPYFPQNANRLGADVVIHSLHKTLPALTQTALIHINGNLADRERIRMYLDMLQSSSPSYVLMAGIDVCVDFLETRSETAFQDYVELLLETRKKLKKLKYLQIVETEHYDCSKIVISVRNFQGGRRNVLLERNQNPALRWNGKTLYDILLERYHLQMEMAAGSYVLAMTSVGDTKEGMERLTDSLFELDAELGRDTEFGRDAKLDRNTELGEDTKLGEIAAYEPKRINSTEPEQVYTSYEAEMLKEKAEEKPWECCLGDISAEYAYLYPPGIPLIVPGERVCAEVIERIRQYEQMGFTIEGIREKGKLRVIS